MHKKCILSATKSIKTLAKKKKVSHNLIKKEKNPPF